MIKDGRKVGAKEAQRRRLGEARFRSRLVREVKPVTSVKSDIELDRKLEKARAAEVSGREIAASGDERRRGRKAANKARKRKAITDPREHPSYRREETATEIIETSFDGQWEQRQLKTVISASALSRALGGSSEPASSAKSGGKVMPLGQIVEDGLRGAGAKFLGVLEKNRAIAAVAGRPRLGDGGKAVPHSVGLPPALARLVEVEWQRRGMTQSEVLRRALEIGLSQMAEEVVSVVDGMDEDLGDG